MAWSNVLFLLLQGRYTPDSCRGLEILKASVLYSIYVEGIAKLE
jgi:hypothetical protein